MKFHYTNISLFRVVESGDASVPVGTHVVAYPGWRSHSKLTKEERKNPEMFRILDNMGGIRRSAGLGILGMPGSAELL